MGGSSSKVPKITAHDKAILDLKVQRDKLKQYQKKLELVIGKEVEVAKHHLKNGDKKRAMLALRKKKYQESLLEKTDAQLFTLDRWQRCLGQIHKEMSVEAVEKLMEDTADAIAYQNEIDELLTGSISKDDEEEAEAELEELLKAELAEAPKVPDNKYPHGLQKLFFPMCRITNFRMSKSPNQNGKSSRRPVAA
ncbi:hypothetical protein BC829DRAFT_381966 [Chytridium lagenaria]|nr:hypothetical protein BC829DRAFT_381966 [Chytridium lagenaria]